ncbi:uncharacterized protein LOC124253383 [Haliotis rubra]|uniref:uncharacterized protein LOC124253383 n=1 Tax=Haliotis rubra TaxID=36100 RepID=UPI001EE54D6C|nr:uncharacterized protein LOC124253383 [Haliotis rubra]
MSSYGETVEEMSPRVSTQVKKELTKGPDTKNYVLPSITVRRSPMKDSMLLYSDHMHKLTLEKKGSKYHLTPREDHAHFAPQNVHVSSSRRKALSLNDLIDRRKKTLHDKRGKPKSARTLPKRRLKHLAPRNLRISFVSASDLHEIIDYSLTCKGSLWEDDKSLKCVPRGIPADKIEYNDASDNSGRPSDCEKSSLGEDTNQISAHLDGSAPLVGDPPLQSHKVNNVTDLAKAETILSSSVKRHTRSFARYRPRRAKRMHLQSPDLGVIPEGDGFGAGEILDEHFTFNQETHPSMASLKAIKKSKAKRNDVFVLPPLNISHAPDARARHTNFNVTQFPPNVKHVESEDKDALVTPPIDKKYVLIPPEKLRCAPVLKGRQTSDKRDVPVESTSSSTHSDDKLQTTKTSQGPIKTCKSLFF